MYVLQPPAWMDPLALLAAFPQPAAAPLLRPARRSRSKGHSESVHVVDDDPGAVQPPKDDLLTSVRRAQAVFDSGGALAISAEGRIHIHEGDHMPFEEGAAYLALRAGVRSCPWRSPGRPGRASRAHLVRIGGPIPTGERPTRHVVARYTALTWHRAPVDGRRRPGPVGPGPDQSLVHGPVQRWAGRPGGRERSRAGSRGRPIPPDRRRRPSGSGALAYSAAMSGAGLSGGAKEYRARLDDQADDQIDRWASELMRDVVKRRGDRQGGRRLSIGREADRG